MSSISYNPSINIPSYHPNDFNISNGEHFNNNYIMSTDNNISSKNLPNNMMYASNNSNSMQYNPNTVYNSNPQYNMNANMQYNPMPPPQYNSTPLYNPNIQQYNSNSLSNPLSYNPSIPSVKSKELFTNIKSDKFNWWLFGKSVTVYTLLFLVMSSMKMNEIVCKFIPFINTNEIICMVTKGVITSILIIIISNILR